jgi:hypothetical protein
MSKMRPTIEDALAELRLAAVRLGQADRCRLLDMYRTAGGRFRDDHPARGWHVALIGLLERTEDLEQDSVRAWVASFDDLD